MPGTCPGHARDMPGTCPGHSRDTAGTYLGHRHGFSRWGSGAVEDIYEFMNDSLNYFWGFSVNSTGHLELRPSVNHLGEQKGKCRFANVNLKLQLTVNFGPNRKAQ